LLSKCRNPYITTAPQAGQHLAAGGGQSSESGDDEDGGSGSDGAGGKNGAQPAAKTVAGKLAHMALHVGTDSRVFLCVSRV